MTAVLPIERAPPALSAWRAHLLALGLVAAAILLLFRRDLADMAVIWWNSSTFGHCLLIPPILYWLVRQRVPELRQIEPSAWAPGLIPIGLGAIAWLLGEAGELALARQAGLVLMLQGAVIACLGKAATRGLAFPLFYALFLIPVGEELVPAMQTVTARIAMPLLGLAGLPAHLEGVFITTPAGYFEIAEACAGVKFLIAMLAFGALVANVCFRSWPRRIAFLAAAVIIPIFANGVRAFGTIYIASRTSLDFAVGFDHVVYGGIFFAIVIALILAAGWPFFDRGVDDPWLADPAGPSEGRGRIGPLAAAALALAALPLAWSGTVMAPGDDRLPQKIALPEVPGWRQAPGGPSWRPHFAGADLFRIARFRDARGREVDLAIAVYRRQSEGREMTGPGQGEAPGWAWTAAAPPPLGGRAERVASHGRVREVASFYRVGTVLTGNGMGVKLEVMRIRLLGGSQRAAAVLVSAEAPAAGVSPRPAIDAFLAALGPVERIADAAAGAE